MAARGVSFRHAVELLRQESPTLSVVRMLPLAVPIGTLACPNPVTRVARTVPARLSARRNRRAAHSWSRMDISTSSYQRPVVQHHLAIATSSTNPAFW